MGHFYITGGVGSPSAIDDILNNPRFQGAIDSISGVTQFADSLFVMFISFIAFFIISAALLRNVIAGAYAAYPKFFDQVAEAKEAAINRVSGMRVGMVAAFFLRLVPDFKSLSDFHDDTIEPKHYFLKAIPQMIGVVMIGVVIYNGYYRDAVSVTAGFGSEIISRVLLSVDPVAVFDKLANSASNPTWAHDNDDSPKGKLIKSLSQETYSKVIGFYTDIKGEQAKTSLGQEVEEWISSQVESIDAQYLTAGAYSIQKQVTRVLGAPNLDSIDNSDSDLVKTVGFSTPVKDLKIDSTQHTEEDWNVRVIVRFNKEASAAPKIGVSSSLTMSVTSSSAKIDKGNLIITMSGGSAKFTAGSGAGAKVNGQYSTTISADGQTLTITGLKAIPGSNSVTVSSLFYSVDGKSSNIKNIKFRASANQLSDDKGDLGTVKWGETLTKKTP